MGTKNTPGKFDCYHKADPDEPLFVLLARDKHASILVELWAALNDLDGESAAKSMEALKCAKDMRRYYDSL